MKIERKYRDHIAFSVAAAIEFQSSMLDGKNRPLNLMTPQVEQDLNSKIDEYRIIGLVKSPLHFLISFNLYS